MRRTRRAVSRRAAATSSDCSTRTGGTSSACIMRPPPPLDSGRAGSTLRMDCTRNEYRSVVGLCFGRTYTRPAVTFGPRLRAGVAELRGPQGTASQLKHLADMGGRDNGRGGRRFPEHHHEELSSCERCRAVQAWMSKGWCSSSGLNQCTAQPCLSCAGRGACTLLPGDQEQERTRASGASGAGEVRLSRSGPGGARPRPCTVR